MAVIELVVCNISGCSPKPQETLTSLAEDEQLALGPKALEALSLLGSPDEFEGQGALTVIGLFDGQNDWEREDRPRTLEEALAVPEERVLVTHGCVAGSGFDFGMCFVNNGGELKGINISEGTTFFVLTIMLPILDAATGGRVTPYRLWRLALSRGRFQENLYCAIKGVDYGPVEHYWGCDPQLFGKLRYGGVPALEETGTPEDIAELLRAAGYWMWMRPDRFPVDISHPTYTRPTPPTLVVLLADSDSSRVPISQLPIELLLSICSDLPLPDIITLATSSKVLYVPLLGTLEACDALAKTYMHTRARWCLPHGEAELKWWNDRNGDEALGWDYMRRCHVENHSMRNRRRIWRAAESIEDECEKVENGVDYSGLVDLFRPLISLD